MSEFKETIQKHAVGIKALTLLMTVGGLGLFGTHTTSTVKDLNAAFLNKGWDKALKVQKDQTGMFFLKCMSNAACSGAYTNIFQKQTPWLSLALAFLGMFGFGIAKRITSSEFDTRLPGAARWATRTDEALQKYLRKTSDFLEKDGSDSRRGYLGLMEDGTQLKPPMGLRCSHAAVMGGPGARKSTGYHKPNMVMDAAEKSTSIVIDLKYPDPRGGFFDMAPAFYALGAPIEVFTPFDENTMRLNLLETATSLEAALELANMIIPQKENDSGSFYRNIERTTLAALLLSVANSERPSMRAVYEQVILGAAKLKEFIMSNPDPEIRDNASAMVDIKTDQLTGIVASLANQLAIFRSTSLARATTPQKGNNLDLRECFRRSTLLYIGIPQGEIMGGRGQVLLQLIKRTIDQAMFDVAKENGGRLNTHTVFYLDEFPSLGPLPGIQQNFATMRSYNVSYQVTLQNRAQGEALYGLPEFKSFFENNLQFQIVFPAFLKMSDAELYSDMMGMTTVLVETESESRRGGINLSPANRTQGRTKSLKAQALLTPDQFLDWTPTMAIVFPIGVRPIPVYMPRLDEKSIDIVDTKGRKRKLVNPNHHYFVELLDQYHRPGKMQEFMKELIGSRQIIKEEELPVRDIPLNEEFRDWMLNLIEHGAHVTPFRDQYKAIVSKQDLPPAMAEPAALSEFIREGWISSLPDKFKLTPEGGRTLGPAIYTRLAALEFGGRLHLWIQANARLLAGHPAAGENPMDDEHLLGYYEPEAVLISKATATEVFGGHTPPDDLITRRGTRTYYRIPLGDEQTMLRIYGLSEMPTKNMESLMKLQAKAEEDKKKAKENPAPAAASAPAADPKAAKTVPAEPSNAPRKDKPREATGLGGGKPKAARTTLGKKEKS